MTAINIAVSGDTLDTSQKSQLAEEITSIFARIETGTEAEIVRNGFLVRFTHHQSTDLYVGGKPAASKGPENRSLLVTIRVMTGPWNKAMKQQLTEEIDSVIRTTIGIRRSAVGGMIWITYIEVADGDWGVDGNVITIEKIAAVFASEQQKRIYSYLKGC